MGNSVQSGLDPKQRTQAKNNLTVFEHSSIKIDSLRREEKNKKCNW